MKAIHIRIIVTVLAGLIPFFAQAQISGSSSVCAGSVTALSDINTGGIWSSSSTLTATVDGSGNVTGIATGVALISYSYVGLSFGLVYDTMSVTVNPVPDAGYLYYPTAGACPGHIIIFNASVPGGTWSSSNTAIATVDGSGDITGIVVGSAIITYTVSNGSCSAFTSASVYVNPLPMPGTITGATSVCIGAVTTLTDLGCGGGGIWSSSNSATASVDGYGNVTCIAAGSTVISYTVTNSCGSASATANVTVNSHPASITAGGSSVCVLSTISLTDASTGGTWMSGNMAIGTVDAVTGVVTGISSGSAPITYTLAGGCYSTTNVSVNPLPNPGSISGSLNLSAGGVATLTDAVSGGVWSSCNSSIASVDGLGDVTGVSDGSTAISYAVSGCGTSYAIAIIIVGNCTTATNISTFAGSHVSGYTGDNGAATAAEMGSPYGIAADAAGNVFIADYNNNVVRMVSHATGIITTIAGTGVAGYNGDNMAGTSAQLNSPRGVTVDASGVHELLYIADEYNERIRQLDLYTGTITTIAGTGNHGGWAGFGYGNGGPASAANLDYPVSVAKDCGGNMYIADLGSQTVRKIDAAGNINLFAGTYAGGYNGDNIPANTAQLNNPSGVAADCSGNVYIADAYNNRVRMVNAAGIITTVAGNGSGAYSGDGGTGTSASLWIPTSITLDACGDLYICDWQNNVVRFLTPVAGGSIITTVAGKNNGDWHGYDGDGGPADSAYLYLPSCVAIDGLGNVYIADYGNYVIRALGTSLPPERKFASGTTQDMNVYENVTTSINSQMAIPDATSGLTETWTVTINPAHGTLSGFNATATSVNGITTPTGLTYTPEPGYTGTDAFTVKMSDGTTAASTTVNVNVLETTAVATVTAQQSIARLYPNPNNGNFQYEFTSAADCQLQVIVTDVTGRVVYKQDVTATPGKNVVSVNLPSDIVRPSLLMVSLGNDNVKYPAVKIAVTE